MVAVLENISGKYHFSETGTGVLVALGISIPELTTNLLSCATFKNEMIGYGFGAIVGSGVFDFTICFGIMSMFSQYHHKRPIKLKLRALLRDIYIYLITIVYLGLVFWDYEVAVLLVGEDHSHGGFHLDPVLPSVPDLLVQREQDA